MIKKFYAKNYKSFQSLDFDVANINILLGSNSCGKSSISNLILMLSQTVDTNEIYHNIFRLNGSKSSLGEALNIFPNKKKGQYVTVGWSITERSITNTRLTTTLLCEIIESYIRSEYFKIRRVASRKQNTDKSRKNIDETKPVVKAIDHISTCQINSNTLTDSDIKEILKNIRYLNKLKKKYLSTKGHNDIFISPIRLSELIETVKLRDACEGNNTVNRVEYKVGYNQISDECELVQLKIFNSSDDCIINVEISESKKILIKSDTINNEILKNSRLDIVRDINLSSLDLFKQSDRFFESSNPLAEYIRQIIGNSCRMFLRELKDSKINHVSPLRALPQRYYLMEKSAHHHTLNAADGTQLAEILKNNPFILEEVNKLFKDFNLKISTAKTNDIIHRITVRQSNVTVELTDVGFGISQVLPIIVQALLCPNNSITIIEQPEIHLHPRMQAWLTNALVSISLKDDKQFIIETHSDTIIKRLQLLMLDPNSSFGSENLNIYHLERQLSGYTKMKNVPFNDFAEISWPDGFMDQEIDDAIKLQMFKVKKIKAVREKNV